jgi:hypothetical protein
MLESHYKAKLVAAVNAMPNGYAQRCEDKFAVGVLDMIIKFPRLPIVFAEGKVITGNLLKPSPGQFHRGNRLGDAGLFAVLIGWKKGAIFISDWKAEAHIDDCWTSAGAGKAQVELLREFICDRQTVQVLRSLRRPGSASPGRLPAPEEQVP